MLHIKQMSFESLHLNPLILKAVGEAGYTEPTPIQAAAIPQVIAGNDLIGIAQTGTGKTAAFTLPMLSKLAALVGDGRKPGVKALVIAPTRELAVQIEENVRIYARHLPLRVATIYGGVGERPQMEALRSGTDLIIACPGRLLDLMRRRHGDFAGLQFLVLDEADRMLDMGFLPSIRAILKSLPQKRQTLLFSATLSKEIEALTSEFLRSPRTVQIGRRSNPAETVTQFVYEVPKHLKQSLLQHLLRDGEMNMVLVFSRTKHGADRIARRLEQDGIRTATLHANRSQNQRLRALNDFKAGTVRVLVATDIAARGIDVDGISHVVNYDFPAQNEDYIHRIGRTGRAQAIGDAISFVAPDEMSELRSLERFIGRGLIRKRADGFDYTAAAPPMMPGERERRGRGGDGDRRNQRPAGGGGGGPRQRSEQQPRPEKPRPGGQPQRSAKEKPQSVNFQGERRRFGASRRRR